MRALAPGTPLPSAFDAVMTRLRADTPALFGPEAAVLPLAYEVRPFSHILRFGVAASPAAPPTTFYFLKIFKPKPVPDGHAQMRRRVVHDYETNRRIHAAMTAFPGCGAVCPVVCYPDDLAVVTEEAQGQTLLAHLEAEAAWFPSAATVANLRGTMARVGAWLRAFQTIDAGTDETSMAEVREYVDIRLVRLVEAGSAVITAARRQALLDRLTALGTRVPPSAWRRVVIHADLAPGNVLVTADRVVVLDFAMASRGTCLHDLTRLFVQTDLLRAKPQFRRAVIDPLLDSLLDGYSPGLTTADPLFRALSILHRVNHLGTLTLQRARFPGNLYNRRLRGFHARWLEQELQSPA